MIISVRWIITSDDFELAKIENVAIRAISDDAAAIDLLRAFHRERTITALQSSPDTKPR